MGSTAVSAALIAGFVCVILLLALRPLAIAHRLVDKPGGRKRHVGHVPIIGGICMFGGFTLGAFVVAPSVHTFFLILGSALLVFVGVIDDRYDLAASVRFGAQFSAVLLMIVGGSVVVETVGSPFFGNEILLGKLSLITTALLATSLINAINMSDGMDGLAGSLSLVALTGLCIAGYGTPVFELALVGVAVVGGFLAFNFPLKRNRSIRTFMGDAGSTFLGFIIAWLCVIVSQPPHSAIAPAAALGLVAIPLYDLTSCFLRRIGSGRSPFVADRNHFHHVLLDAGLKRRPALAVLLTLSIAVAVVCLSLAAIGVGDGIIFGLWVISGLTIDAGLRGYRRWWLSRKQAYS